VDSRLSALLEADYDGGVKMTENKSYHTCKNCSHSEVCRYKDYFNLIVEAALSANVITDLTDPEMPTAPIAECNWINVRIGCEKFGHRNVVDVRKEQ